MQQNYVEEETEPRVTDLSFKRSPRAAVLPAYYGSWIRTDCCAVHFSVACVLKYLAPHSVAPALYGLLRSRLCV